MDWREHVATALDGEHPVLGRSVTLVLYGLILFSTLSIGIETLPLDDLLGDRAEFRVPEPAGIGRGHAISLWEHE